MELDFEKICRTCLSSECSLVSIFENNIIDVSGSESATTVIDLLTTLTDIKISANDCLPDRICPACLEEIKRAYSFKIKCENSDNVLNRYLQEYCTKMVENADSNGTAAAKLMPYTRLSKRKLIKKNDKVLDENKITPVKNEMLAEHNDDDVVCLSDEDDEFDGKDQSKPHFAMSTKSTTEPEQIEISDDDDEDGFHEYNFDSGYALDEDSLQENSENISDSQSPFANQDYYSIQGFDSDYLVCSVCSQMFQSTVELKRHIKDSHTEGLTCNICQRDFSSSSNLFEHCSVHIPICYPCPICGYKLKQEKYLKKHLERHARDKEVKCDLCDQLFLTSSEMRVHVLLNHTEEIDSTYKCNTCGLKLPNANLLESHKEKHNSVVRNHICDVCSKAFRSKTKLTEHYRLHTGEKPYICQYCHKQFRLQFSLRMHMAIHTNEHFFKCRICYTTFRQRSELQKHIQMHRESMSISANDCLPEKICYTCVEEIKRAYTFKLRCENSEFMLYRYLNQNYTKLQNKINTLNYHNSDIPYLPPEISITIDTNEKGQEVEFKVDDKPCNLSKKPYNLSKANKKGQIQEDVVCLSDDDEDIEDDMDCNDSTTNQSSNNQQNASYEIEISDDEENNIVRKGKRSRDHDSRHPNGVYQVLDYESIKKFAGNISDAYQAFLNPDSSNDYSSQYDISDAESGPRECPKCTQLFESVGELKRHIREQHTRGFECNICKRVLKSHTSLSAHITTHVPQFYPCPICGFKVKQRKYLTKHLEQHNGTKTYKCELCEDSFYNMTELRAHNFLAHAVEKDSPFKCYVCGIKLPSQEGLDVHVAKHNQVVRNHVCDVCHKAFRDKTGLNTHYRVHTGEKPHTCPYCQRGFTTQYSLKMHVAIHTNEEFHKCAICLMKFRYRSAMVKHMEEHRNNSI